MNCFLRYVMPFVVGLMLSACSGSNSSSNGDQSDRTPTVATDTSDSLLLVPGQSAGHLKLGDSDSLLLQTYGPPDLSDAAMGKALLVWHTDTSIDQTYPLSVFTARDMGNDETARLQKIRITSPLFETAESIHVGSNLNEITVHYPATLLETYEVDGASYSIYNTPNGIAFELDSTDHCVAIIIHDEKDTTSSYLPLRGEQ